MAGSKDGDAAGCSCWPIVLPFKRGHGGARNPHLTPQTADKLVQMATRKMEKDAKYKKARQRAWTGSADQKQAAYKVGEKAFAQNPHYEDGTRLRSGPTRESDFNGHQVLNDAEIVVVEVSDDFAKVRIVASEEGAEAPEGWLRQRNLTRAKQRPGMLSAKGAPERRIGLTRPTHPSVRASGVGDRSDGTSEVAQTL